MFRHALVLVMINVLFSFCLLVFKTRQCHTKVEEHGTSTHHLGDAGCWFRSLTSASHSLTHGQILETHLVLLRDSLEVVQEQVLVLWQQGEHHSQPIENQQEAFRQGSLVCAQHTQHSLPLSQHVL